MSASTSNQYHLNIIFISNYHYHYQYNDSPDDHHHDDDDESGEGVEAAADDAAAPKSTFKVDEIIPIVDSILEQDDKVKGKTCLFSLCVIEIIFLFCSE